MNRFRVRAGSAAAALALLLTCALAGAPAAADTIPDVWFAGTRLIFDRPQLRGADIAVATNDSGLARLLARVGATLAYQPGQRYVVVTTADRRTITLTIGDTRVAAGGITTSAPFAPYVMGSDVYVPLATLARALYVQPQFDGSALVLQPHFGTLDVRSDDRATVVTLVGATPLTFKRTTMTDGRLTLTFSGVGSSLDQTRTVAGPGLAQIGVLATGSVRNPTTAVSFDSPPGTQHVILASPASNQLVLAFAPPGVALRGSDIPTQGNAAAFVSAEAAAGPVARSVPAPPVPDEMRPPQAPPNPGDGGASPAPLPSPAAVSAVDLIPGAEGTSQVRIALSGGVDYEWHRLGDGRWYVDLRGATLAMAPRDDTPGTGGIDGLRVHQFALDPVPIVRVTLSLSSPRHVDLVAGPPGLVVTVANADDLAAARIGAGRVGDGTSYPGADLGPAPSATPWKFGSEQQSLPAATNPHLIVLDPGHGGSDVGAQHNGLTEKDVTLDIARRLRTVLAARGWTVRMTRDSDTDVYAPNDSAHDELQARCDVANKAGARMFVSIHANSFTSSSLSGTTTYYYKGIDLSLAREVHRRLIDELGTKDDGVRKDNFYVVHHTTMPAILVETAFLSNSGDAALLSSPAFLQRIATAIADGVGDYARLPQSAAQTGDDSDQN